MFFYRGYKGHNVVRKNRHTAYLKLLGVRPLNPKKINLGYAAWGINMSICTVIGESLVQGPTPKIKVQKKNWSVNL